MNNLPPEMAKLLMGKIMEEMRTGKVKAIAVKFGDGEDDEMPMGDKEEGSGECCGKCGCECEAEDNYCRECGEDLNKEMPNPDKDKEGKGDIDTKAVAKQEYGGDNGGSNEEEIKNVERLKEFSKKK